MPRGRKPVPTALHELRGNPGKRGRRKDEPKPKQGIPECPEHLSDAAKQEWFRITPELHAAGVLAKVDRAALAGYCAAYARWVEAEEKVAESGGLVVKAPSGYPMQNPYLAISNRALEDIRKFAAEFGMTPSSRTRIGTGDAPAEEDPADTFFDGPKAAS